jgi:hypothetical protein
MMVRLGQTVKGVKAKLEARRQGQSKDSETSYKTNNWQEELRQQGRPGVVIKP